MENQGIVPKEMMSSYKELLTSSFGFVAASPKMKLLKSNLSELAAGRKTVSIFGPSGSGRLSLARALHLGSADWWRSFIVADFSGHDDEDALKNLLGFMEGHFFASAELKEGVLSKGAESTICFRNIQNYSPVILDKLYQVAASKRYQPISFDEVLPMNSRLVFTSDRAPRELYKSGKVGKEFFEILDEYVVEIPVLSKRREAIVPLAEKFINDAREEFGLGRKILSKEAEKWLKKAPWLGNVDQLKKSCYFACINSSGKALEPANFALAHDGNIEEYKKNQLDEVSLQEIVEMKLESFIGRLGTYEATHLYEGIMDRVEEPLLKLILNYSNGNQIKASRMLGINRNTLRAKVKKYNLKVRRK